MELFRALGALSEAPAGEHAVLAEALDLGPPPPPEEHTELFVFQLPPYASIYLGEEGMLGGEARDRVAGFWRALGLEPPPECDHLAHLLIFYTELCEGASAPDTHEDVRARFAHARGAFLHEHLLPWLPLYLAALETLAPPFYRRWCELLAAALDAELESLEAPASLALHLRTASPLPDPRSEGGDAFIAGLLAPVRCGAILTRADLARAAADCDLGLRQGERRYILEALLAQDAAAVLAWLAGEIRARRTIPQTLPPAVADFWRQRARSSASLLEELEREASRSLSEMLQPKANPSV